VPRAADCTVTAADEDLVAETKRFPAARRGITADRSQTVAHSTLNTMKPRIVDEMRTEA
jgi:hypothetical protein